MTPSELKKIGAFSFYMITRDRGIEKWLKERSFVPVDNQWMADFAVFPGGEDVTPELYGDHTLHCTNANFQRDRREIAAFHNLPVWMPKVGICRGAQFLNVMAGGKLWQDVDGHACGVHVALDQESGKYHKVTSTHHQMMRPAPDGLVLMTASISKEFRSSESVYKYAVPREDIEAVWYDEENILCFQPHPEYTEVPECEEIFWDYFAAYVAPAIEEAVEPFTSPYGSN